MGILCGGNAVAGPVVAAAPPSPPRDAFYDHPADLATLAPGSIIRTRKITARSLQLLPINVDAWQLLYRTSGADKQPDATVTTVLVPRGKRPTKLLSYQAATDSTLRQCNPSYSLRTGLPVSFSTRPGPLTFALPGAEVLLASAGLAQGWAVALPDHGGTSARFLTPRQPGYATLDGIRAVQNFSPMRMSAKTPVGLWGYSGGAIASSWAIEEKQSYAPELTITGAAFGAPERDLTASLRSVNGALLGGLIPIALDGISKDSPGFRTAIRRYLTPQGRAVLAETGNQCIGQNALLNLWFDYRRYLTKPLNVVLADPVIKREIAARSITGRSTSVPTYIYNGVNEEVAPISGTDKLVRSYCAGGAPVTYRRELLPPNIPQQIFSTHGTVAITGAPGAFAWLKSRMNSGGAPARSGCDVSTVPATLTNAGALGELGPSFIVNPLATMLGLPIGS
ncbi:putative lipase [Gordonia soli NBRC 108243]|uniref:Putative lipase n=2 Tax=Gordonia soli TaxID=320799 RepID=M0QIF3_9ACTN|nr:putative lipase [Gordonia soli NBRC 108243]